MTERTAPAEAGWFADVDPGSIEEASRAITEGATDEPSDWPGLAVEAGFADTKDEYYDLLHAATIQAARSEARERERADDKQLVHAVRAMYDCRRTANELAERVAEWAGARYDDAGSGVGYARELVEAADATDGETADETEGPQAGTSSETDQVPADDRLLSLAKRTADLADEADELERYVESVAPDVAPNLAAMAGPVLAARLVSLAGGLEELAKQPSSTVQVLGAEDALFAHLRGTAPSPKHGVIFTHEYVRGTRDEKRGSAARALAGKLSIAARVDHYSGDRRPELGTELDERIRRVRGEDHPETDGSAETEGTSEVDGGEDS